jgi:hypothetical protein
MNNDGSASDSELKRFCSTIPEKGQRTTISAFYNPNTAKLEYRNFRVVPVTEEEEAEEKRREAAETCRLLMKSAKPSDLSALLDEKCREAGLTRKQYLSKLRNSRSINL